MAPTEIISYLKAHKHYLNIAGIARQAGMAGSTLHSILNETPNSNGKPRVLPTRTIPVLSAVITKLSLA